MSHDKFSLFPAIGKDDGLFIQGLFEQVFIVFPVADITGVYPVYIAGNMEYIGTLRHERPSKTTLGCSWGKNAFGFGAHGAA
jgi:hypothetical protein